MIIINHLTQFNSSHWWWLLIIWLSSTCLKYTMLCYKKEPTEERKYTIVQDARSHLVDQKFWRGVWRLTTGKGYLIVFSARSHLVLLDAWIMRAHSCSECEKSFRQVGHLRRHMITRTGETVHKCRRMWRFLWSSWKSWKAQANPQ